MTNFVNALIASLAIAVAPHSAGEVQARSIQRAIDRGKILYEYDRAARLTTDDMLHHVPAIRQTDVGGWIVTPSAKGMHVDYVGKDGASDRVIYAADVIGDEVENSIVYPAATESVLKEPALQMARALRAARTEMDRHADWRPCTNAPFNTIVLPPQTDGAVPVYFLTSQTVMGSFPFGGHYEVDITADGKTVGARPFTKSCITMEKPPRHSGQPAGLFVTHLLDPYPTEIHVFEQYYAGVPVFVGTGPTTVWRVEDTRIENVSSLMAH